MIRARPHHQPPAAAVRSHGEGRAEVLSVLSEGDDQWTDYRGRRIGEWLAARGIAHGWCHNADAAWLIEEARGRGARVILSEAQVIAPATMAKIAAALPGVRCVHLLHGVPAWCASSAPGLTYAAIRQARDLPNVWVGTVSDPESMAWIKGAKVIHLPNPVEIPDGLVASAGSGVGELCVSIVARPAPVKNWGGMLAALALLAARRPVRALIVGRGHTPNHREHLGYLAGLGIEAETMDAGDWAETLRWIAARAHVGLACGFSDSLNLVAAEHCLMGIPVVGSPALDWLPKACRANPNDPREIAATAWRLAAGWQGTSGRELRTIARAMARENEELLLRNLMTWIEP